MYTEISDWAICQVTVIEHGDRITQMNNGFEFEGGEIQVWIEQEQIHIIACDKKYRDLVELKADTARELAAKLLDLADRIGD